MISFYKFQMARSGTQMPFAIQGALLRTSRGTGIYSDAAIVERATSTLSSNASSTGNDISLTVSGKAARLRHANPTHKGPHSRVQLRVACRKRDKLQQSGRLGQ